MQNSKDDIYLKELESEVQRLKSLPDAELRELQVFSDFERKRDGLTSLSVCGTNVTRKVLMRTLFKPNVTFSGVMDICL